MLALAASKKNHYIYSSTSLEGQGSPTVYKWYWISVSFNGMVLPKLTVFTATLPQKANSPGQNGFTPLLVLRMLGSFYVLMNDFVFF